MNIFRLAADLLHLGSIFILIARLRQTKSCAGISLKTQGLYVLVFATRYLDMFISFVSVYNTLMKLFFLASSGYIVFLMMSPLKPTYDKALDTLRIEYLVAGAAAFALLFPHKYTVLEVLWSFSIYLEAVAIMPQLLQMTRTGEADNITSHYVFALGGYRALYIVNWIYRYYTEDNYSDYIAWVAGVVQTVLYGDFFYIYFTRILKGKTFKLPV
ncbi:endoplasmic reticulum retention protein [Coemansia aciculifera]|uniref:ER lumen protein-retaining receptor n=2 Tax=Coemansia TaxID=4863 RepID=A0A9W8H489_9FUNG|nr:endoplasmic reticulum retention protein [Coemansia sp. S146]KAJ2757334.1 endoplasmic reticulum retention protein [Coemansia pectinata]KAJ2863767.1 endoplasmic reticulum retention protein [Coemansia aciculifera]KAJ2874696.1 endoplasmic reticulum retention protein [Coemansia aciculifera]KAJ2885262.1 endoplasmic reticulum retention protein [Coemansia aciculifera]